MRILTCTVDADPCPADKVASVALVDTIDLAALGITPSSVAYVYGWGVAAVLGLFLIGYVGAAAIRGIRML